MTQMPSPLEKGGKYEQTAPHGRLPLTCSCLGLEEPAASDQHTYHQKCFWKLWQVLHSGQGFLPVLFWEACSAGPQAAPPSAPIKTWTSCLLNPCHSHTWGLLLEDIQNLPGFAGQRVPSSWKFLCCAWSCCQELTPSCILPLHCTNNLLQLWAGHSSPLVFFFKMRQCHFHSTNKGRQLHFSSRPEATTAEFDILAGHLGSEGWWCGPDCGREQ